MKDWGADPVFCGHRKLVDMIMQMLSYLINIAFSDTRKIIFMLLRNI